MEEMELEEGEACLNKKDVDATFDPDVDFSYIDAKLENVLGHFQKDFEGGVSAENLGSKFGGYGSFLPTYQRSPVWSDPKVQSENAVKPPNNLPLEGSRSHSVSSSALSARHGSTALGAATLPVPRASSVDNCVTRQVTMPVTSAKNKSDSQSDQKNYKVRIRMASDNWSTKNKTEIYSGLGLDISPTSSFEDSPTDGKLACEPRDSPEFSPTSILEIMKSFPLHDSLLLSPLCDDLVCSTDKDMLFRRSGAVPVTHRGNQEGSLVSVNDSDTGRSDRNLVREKKTKSSEKKAFTSESKSTNVHGTHNGVDVLLKKERDVDTSACDEIVSNALRLPLLSSTVADSAKDTARTAAVSRVVNKSRMEEKFHDLAKDEPHGPTSVLGDAFIGKANEKAVSRTKKTNSYDDQSRYPAKGGNLKGERIDISLSVDPHMSRERQGFNPELKSVPSVDDDVKASSGRKDRYKEFFGEDLEDDNCSAGEEGYGEFKSVTEDRSNRKKYDQLSGSEALIKASSGLLPPTKNSPIPNVAAPQVPFVKEDWVCCDKCQKWRLLPAGKNPNSLPKIWLCSMLNWLDGMNRCSISEEETTKAVLSLQQTFASASVHQGQNSRNRYSGVVSSGVVDALHAELSVQDVGGRKNHCIKDVFNASSHISSSPYSDSKKKILQAPFETQSLNGENHFASFNKDEFSGQSSGLVGQKRKHRKKEKSIPLANTVEGDSKSLKMRNSGEKNQEFSKSPKKLKAGGVHIDKNWKSGNGAAALKVCCSSTNNLSVNKSQELQDKHDDHLKESKRDLKVNVRSEDRTQFPSDVSLLRTENFTDGDVRKRKISEYQGSQQYATSRSNEGHRLEHHMDSIEETNESNHHKDKKAKVSRSEGKESFTSKGSGRFDNKGRSLKDQQAGGDLEKGHFRRSLDVVSFKKDTGSTQPAVAATSSSSKVSGSCKSKTNLQGVKDSPVESVSSSPLRNFNQDKFMLTRRDLVGKSDPEELSLATSSPGKCSDGEDGAPIDQSRMVQKNVTITDIKHGSRESSMHDFQDRNQSDISRKNILPEAVSTHHVTGTSKSDQYPRKPLISEECPNDESGKRYEYHNNGSRRKFGNGSSRSKDKSRGTKSDSEKGYLRDADSNGYADHGSHIENSKARSKVQEKIALNSDKVEKDLFSKNDLAANSLFESGKREAQSNQASFNNTGIRQNISNYGSEPNQPMDCNSDKSLKKFSTYKTDWVDVHEIAKSNILPPSGRGQNEMERWPQPINGIQKDNGVKLSTVSTSECDDALKANKQITKAENQRGNGIHPSNPPNPTNGHKGRNIDASSSIRRDSTSQAANSAVKEAKDLKHLADRLKNSGSIIESMGLYVQAALKFLYGASLLESSNSENSKHGEAIQSVQMYSSTAKLCEFCAHEYEKLKDFASAALAYKCVEVAYLRVIYSSHSSASRDRHELQIALQIVPPGESPSSSASDVDNLNNIATIDKVTVTKGVNSPQVSGNHVIPARNRPNFARLLNFVQDANFAMEASRKSRNAFIIANSREEIKYWDGLASVKRALDFSFQDMDGFLRLVRLAMEAISR